jgi:hypothetical protein
MFFELLVNHFSKWVAHMDRANYLEGELAKLVDYLPFHSVVIHMDFAENGSLDPRVENQGARWTGSKQYSLHPVVIRAHILMYRGLDPAFVEEFMSFRAAHNLPMTYTKVVYFVSDDLGHDVEFVLHVKKIIHEKYFSKMDAGPTCDCDARCK